MKRLLAIVVLMLVITCLAFGQQQTAPPPKPGPEVSRLGSVVGTWKTDYVFATITLVTAALFAQTQTTANTEAHADWDRAPAPLGKLVDIGGRKLHLHCTGTGSPTVIVENGSSGFSIDWALVQPQVARFTRICTYDRAGFAWSDHGPAINTVEETMDDLYLLLRTASIPPPYILTGQSIGGLYIRAYQRRHPGDVVGMVLVDATPEEDARYMVNGKDKVGIEMTYDDMKDVYAPLLLKPAPDPELPNEVEEPFDRLPPDLQRDRMWAWRKFVRESVPDNAHWWVSAESWKEEFVALRRARLSQPHVLGDLPLVVLHRGRRTDAILNRREAELALMSRRGEERVAPESDHYIHLYQPDLVAKAIRNVFDASHAKLKGNLHNRTTVPRP